jgi:hypothetical protein
MRSRLSFDLEPFPSGKRERLQLRLSELLFTTEECLKLAAEVEESSVRSLQRINDEASALLHRLSS